MAGVLVLGVLALAFGTGYTATQAVSNDDSAWLQKGDTVVQINGPSARFDAVVANQPVSLAAQINDRLEVIEDPNGQVYVADPSSHDVYQIDLSTMEPESLGSPGTSVLAAASSHYVVDAPSGTVREFDPKTLALAAPLKIPGGIASSAVAPSGTAYIGSDNGSVTEITGDKASTFPIASRGQQMDVSVVGSQPVAVDVTDGQLHLLSNTGASNGPIISLPGVSGSTVELSPSLSAGNLWLIRGTELEQVNLSTTQTSVAQLSTTDVYGAPVSNAGDAYVPDETANKVIVYDPLMGSLKTVSVPSGRAGAEGLELEVRDGAVWVDDPTSSEATVISANGSSKTVQKGTGDGVVAPGSSSKPKSSKPNPPKKTPPTATTVPPGSHSSAPTTVPAAPTVTPTPVVTTPTPPVTTTVPVTTVPTPTTTPAPPTTAEAEVKVPTDLVGQSITAACSKLTQDKLVCDQINEGAAPQGQQPDVVTKVPDSGKTVPAQTKVEIDYYGSAYTATVPDPGTDTYDTYCASVEQAGLVCNPDDVGTPPAGDALDQVGTVTPAPGSSESTGTTVTIDYYGLVPAPNCAGAQADASGTACTAGAYSSDISIAASAQSTPSDVACDTVWTQSVAAGQGMAQGSVLTVDYDPNCSEPLYEWEVCGNRYHYLSPGVDSQPSGQTANATCSASTVGDWSSFTLATQSNSNLLGYVYPPGTQKAGTEGVYEFSDPDGSCTHTTGSTQGISPCTAYDYSIDPNAELSSGWSSDGIVFYVSDANSASPGAGLVPIDAAELDPYGTPGPRGWYTYDYCGTVSSSNCQTEFFAWDIYSV